MFVAASLYGAKRKYMDGALKVAKDVATWSHPHFVGATFVVYHDDTVPPDILQSLRYNGAVTIDKTHLGLKHELRTFWRFLALCEYDTCFITDVDFIQNLHERLSRNADLLHTSDGSSLLCGERGYRYHHERQVAFDAGAFGGCHLQHIGWDIPQQIQTFIEHSRPLAFKGRYAKYYGNDEVFLEECVRLLMSRGARIEEVSAFYTRRPVRTCVSGINGTLRKIQLSNIQIDAPVTEESTLPSMWEPVQKQLRS